MNGDESDPSMCLYAEALYAHLPNRAIADLSQRLLLPGIVKLEVPIIFCNQVTMG